MSRPNQRWITPHPEGGWKVVKPGSSRPSAILPTQREAIDRARTMLQNDYGGELVIQGRDRKIRDSDTVPPANDPYPPRDHR